jgi:hypothetical protein
MPDKYRVASVQQSTDAIFLFAMLRKILEFEHKETHNAVLRIRERLSMTQFMNFNLELAGI